MAVDLIAYNELIDRMQRHLDAHGPAEDAERLRRDTPAVMRLACGAQDRHDALTREPQPTTDRQPKTDVITPNARNPA